MRRETIISTIEQTDKLWDIAIIGGGATGIGAAVEAASRGYSVVLVEQSDFGKGTSSRSTKLAHGGVRYLQQGNISLVLEALKERGIMRRNAPHLVHDLPFIVPVYDWWEGPFYGIGLKIYDMLAGKEGFGSSKLLSKEETIAHIPTVETEGLRGGVIYHDGQFDDARMLINLMQTAQEHGATLLNYAKVTELYKPNNELSGIVIEDIETGKQHIIKAKVVINATGVFTDTVRKMDDEQAKNILTSSQGVHLVLDSSFLPGDAAIMVPHTSDGRVLFAVPWHNSTLIGTTDTYVEEFPLEPMAQEEEVEFLLTHAAKYLTKDPQRCDIKGLFVGLRPLVKSSNSDDNTAAISRDHTISISRNGLISIAGGKWTTYRKMAEDVIDQAIDLKDLPRKNSISATLKIHGYKSDIVKDNHFAVYGSDLEALEQLCSEAPEYAMPLHPKYAIKVGEVIWAVRHEMARTVEDFLSRRIRLLLLDTRISIEVAPIVAKTMAKELKHDKNWEINQVANFNQIALNYLPQMP